MVTYGIDTVEISQFHQAFTSTNLQEASLDLVHGFEFEGTPFFKLFLTHPFLI
jgi:hypothetical protein